MALTCIWNWMRHHVELASFDRDIMLNWHCLTENFTLLGCFEIECHWSLDDNG